MVPSFNLKVEILSVISFPDVKKKTISRVFIFTNLSPRDSSEINSVNLIRDQVFLPPVCFSFLTSLNHVFLCKFELGFARN